MNYYFKYVIMYGDKMKNDNKFNYTYSASKQEEIEAIRKKYVFDETKTESKIDELRRLDKNSAKKGTAFSITLGTLGTLLFGLGMTCVLEWANKLFVPGIFIGIAGLACVSAAHPLYLHLTNLERRKIAPRIIELTDELSGK